MGKNLVQKIVEKHLVQGSYESQEWALKVDQTLTQDATGTMACLQFEEMGVKKIKTEVSVSYVDHNITFSGRDQAVFLESFADCYGIVFSPPGNGICHQVHLERFALPGKTLLGSDSHTPTAGGMGALAIGAGGLDVAAAMAGWPFYLKKQKIIGVHLKGRLAPWSAAKDIALELLKRLSIRGAVNCVLEYFGEGVESLTVPQRATAANVGTETGATSSIFPSDEKTLAFLRAQGREIGYLPLSRDPDSSCDQLLTIDLSSLEPLIALPSMPDNVKRVCEIEGVPVAQVIIGSCTNSSLGDLMLAAEILRRHKIAPGTELHINPGSRQVVMCLKELGLWKHLKEQAHMTEPGCHGCIGMGQEPPAGSAAVRTFNRNFPGRSGTPNDRVYLCSVETAIAAAVFGSIQHPQKLGESILIEMPQKYADSDAALKFPRFSRAIKRTDSIAPLPSHGELGDSLSGPVLIKVGDNITTDDIIPAGPQTIPLRANIPRLSEHVFRRLDPGFSDRAARSGGGFIVAGENYGQGSSREHAALCPMFLGVKAVLAKSFARLHQTNLVNFGILPLVFPSPTDYAGLEADDELQLEDVRQALFSNLPIPAVIAASRKKFFLHYNLSSRQKEIILAGGLLNLIRLKSAE